ncbi:hypothetical protein CHM34_11765 [Paludifilum halophilum]|uniref:Pantothenate kinase n=1 Tax=Paludifilum halophilum TaxID=1642702 RepID=A0A235B427_9BACL|nr:hypothetical protein CHM34_11765 [Paludifilum halophilum]
MTTDTCFSSYRSFAREEWRKLRASAPLPLSKKEPFSANVKAGLPEVEAPVYSHLAYDILPDEVQVVRQPEILIIEGF